MFHIHPVPDKVMTLVIQHMYAALSSSSSSAATTATAAAASLTSRDQSHVCSIARLLFVLGQTCLSSLVYTEAIAATAKKYPRPSSCKDSLGGGRESNTRGAAKTSPSPSLSSSSSSSSGEGVGFTENVEAVDAMEEEMGAAAADDADQEKVPIYPIYLSHS